METDGRISGMEDKVWVMQYSDRKRRKKYISITTVSKNSQHIQYTKSMEATSKLV